jgi:hypothetical protein
LQIKDAKQVTQLINEQILEIHNKNDDAVKNKQILEELTRKVDEMEKKDQKLSKVMEILVKNEKTLKALITKI